MQLEQFQKIVSNVLSTFLVAVQHGVFPAFAIGLGDAFVYLSQKGVEVSVDVFFAQLVGFQSGGLGRGGTVFNSSRSHSGAENHPVAFGNVPVEGSVGRQMCRDVRNLFGGNEKRRVGERCGSSC